MLFQTASVRGIKMTGVRAAALDFCYGRVLLYWIEHFRAEEACWAHNPKVVGSRPTSAIVIHARPVRLLCHLELSLSVCFCYYRYVADKQDDAVFCYAIYVTCTYLEVTSPRTRSNIVRSNSMQTAGV